MVTTDFGNIAAAKSDDELIDIILKKDEFRLELVEAAEIELKKRRGKRSTENPNLSNRPANEVIQELKVSSQEKEPTMGIYLAAVISFIMFPIWIVIVVAQGFVSLISDSSILAVLATSNFFVSMVRLVVGIGIYKLKPWGYNWGLGSALLNMVLMAYFSTQDGSGFFLFLTMTEAVVALALYTNRDLFNLPAAVIKPSEHKTEPPTSSETIQNLTPEYIASLVKLSELIKKESGRFIGKSLKAEIIGILNDTIKSKEDGKMLLASYRAEIGKSLTDDLMGLTSNYLSMKEYLKPLITFGIVEVEYPHDLKRS